MQKIRTIFQPDLEKEVHDDEAEMLRRQGLLHEPAPEPSLAEPAPRTPAQPEPAPTPTPMPKGAPTDGDK